MAAKDIIVNCPAGLWTELTDEAVATAIHIEVTSKAGVLTRATAEAGTSPAVTIPTATGNDGFPLLARGSGWEATIVAKFPGVAGANRIFAKPIPGLSSAGSAAVRISYA